MTVEILNVMSVFFAFNNTQFKTLQKFIELDEKVIRSRFVSFCF